MTDHINIHPEERDIERYVLKSPALADEEREFVAAHIEQCATCREVERYFEAFYLHLSISLENPPAAELEQWLDKARSQAEARVLYLQPVVPKSHLADGKPGVIALAAQDSDTLPRYTPVQTLSAEDESTLIRISRDNKTGTFNTQVISDDPEKFDRVMVTFDRIPERIFTDRHGEAVLPLPPDKKPHDLHAYVNLPAAVFALTTEDVEQLRQDTQTVITNDAGDELTMKLEGDFVSVSCSGESVTEFFGTLAVFSPSVTHHAIMASGIAIFPMSSLSGDSVIKLFRSA